MKGGKRLLIHKINCSVNASTYRNLSMFFYIFKFGYALKIS